MAMLLFFALQGGKIPAKTLQYRVDTTLIYEQASHKKDEDEVASVMWVRFRS